MGVEVGVGDGVGVVVGVGDKILLTTGYSTWCSTLSRGYSRSCATIPMNVMTIYQTIRYS